jgi:glycosyltransferase involved in cell wall biosynthesis
LPAYQREEDVEIVRFSQSAPHFLERAAGYGIRLRSLLDEHGGALALCHFRDPWAGVEIVDHGRSSGYAAVYEVNGLPSIELPFLYPAIPADVLTAVETLEQHCLDRADAVITPSAVTAGLLSSRGVPAERLHVIPNGADPVLHGPVEWPAELPGRYLVYFGALQRWQGVDMALRALSRLRDFEDLELVICSSTRARRAKPYRKLAEKLGVGDRVRWQFALTQPQLAGWLQGAVLSLAPLRDCSRNALQGCAPLKIIESLAVGVPVVASDLPAVRELVEDGEHGTLVAPDRPGELARAIRLLLDHPQQREVMSASARAHVAARFTWQRSTDRLRKIYDQLAPAV